LKLWKIYSAICALKYEFDEEPTVRQEWTLSDDNTALFLCRDPTAFTREPRKANQSITEVCGRARNTTDVSPRVAVSVRHRRRSTRRPVIRAGYRTEKQAGQPPALDAASYFLSRSAVIPAAK
jgi:hypothetical protein